MSNPNNLGGKVPGIPLDQFRAAVETIAELRDAGKALVFLRPNRRVRIVWLSGSAAHFPQLLSERLPGTDTGLSEAEARTTLQEIEQIVSAILAAENETEAARKVLLVQIKEFREETKFDRGEPTHELVFNKVQATMKLVTEALKQRLTRLQSVTVPLLEDLDAELVRERQDKITGRRVDVPFLRLRLRYSEQPLPSVSEFGPVTFIFSFAGFSKSFELECDLSDLDLLQQRLDEARQMLLDGAGLKEVGDDK